MEHEIYVPFSATVVRAALAEPERVARSVPGLQREPGDDPEVLGGRLRLRIASSTITYRGTLRITERGEGIAVEAEGAEARGNGSARLRLTVVPHSAPDGSGTTLAFSGEVTASGRVTEFSARQQHSAARRLLDRFTEALVADLSTAEPTALGRPDDDEPAIPGIPAPDSGGGDTVAPTAETSAAAEPRDETASGTGELGGAMPGEQPPASLGTDPAAETVEPGRPGGPSGPETGAAAPAPDAADGPLGEGAPDNGPEADLARRTMIGRSAEEVDHAPPRGRYAPREPAGIGTEPRTPLRWAVPVAVAAVVGAVAVRRRLRRRR